MARKVVPCPWQHHRPLAPLPRSALRTSIGRAHRVGTQRPRRRSGARGALDDACGARPAIAHLAALAAAPGALAAGDPLRRARLRLLVGRRHPARAGRCARRAGGGGRGQRARARGAAGPVGRGAPAVAYAARHPERVRHLVLHGGYTGRLLHRSPEPRGAGLSRGAGASDGAGLGPARLGGAAVLHQPACCPTPRRRRPRALNEQQRLSCGRPGAPQPSCAPAPARRAPAARPGALPDAGAAQRRRRVVPLELGRGLAAAIPGARFETLRSRNHIPLARRAGLRALLRRHHRVRRGRAGDAASASPARERELLDAGRAGSTTCRSPPTWAWPTRRCATRSRCSTPSSASKADLRPWCARASSASAGPERSVLSSRPGSPGTASMAVIETRDICPVASRTAVRSNGSIATPEPSMFRPPP